MVRVNNFDYQFIKSDYLQKMLKGHSLSHVVSFIKQEHGLEDKQTQKMLKELKEYTEIYQKDLEIKLFEVLEVLRLPEKWAVDSNNNIIKAFPQPVLSSAYRVIDVEYKPYKSYLLPEELWQAYIRLQDEIDQAKPKGKYSYDTVYKWTKMNDQGVTYAEIGRQYGASPSTVSKYIKLYTKGLF